MPEYYWDANEGRYRYKTNRQPIRESKVNDLVQETIRLNKADMVDLTEQFLEGSLGFEDWQRQIAGRLTNLSQQNYLLGLGGLKNMTQGDVAIVQDMTNSQLNFFSRFAQAIENGRQTDGQIRRRTSNYVQGTSATFHAGALQSHVRSGMRYMRRILNDAAHPHCEDCLRYAARGRVKIGSLPLPTMQCQCRQNCKCTVLYS